MNKKEFHGIMNSDQKLWELAETVNQTPSTITKAIDVPWDIGRIEITFEGTDNAIGLRAAFEQFGQYIRTEVKERISDEAVVSRAKQAAAKVSFDSDQLSVESADDSYTRGMEWKRQSFQEVADQEAISPLSIPATFSTEPITRISELREWIESATDAINSARREVSALEAYLEVINAPGNEKAPQPSEEAALEEVEES